MKDQTIHIIGAGPAGLTAAINLAKAGYATVVHEKQDDVGKRFNGDFQGVENWSTKEDALAFLERHGLNINFLCAPQYNGTFYDARPVEFSVRSQRPLFYLIERGNGVTSFDQGLKQQAMQAGVQFKWKETVTEMPAERTIVSTGPKAADIIAQGIVFKTSHPNGYYGFLDDRIAPKGYAYLLVNESKATFATCMFEDFRNSQTYFERALDRLKQTVDIDIRDAKPFGGFGNFFLPTTSTGENRTALYVGESAGYQDALWGFGIRYAVLSGYLAAQSMIHGLDYDRLVEEYILPLQKISLANRFLFDRSGNRSRQYLLNRLSKSDDVQGILQKQHRLTPFKRLLFAVAKRWYHTRLIDKNCLHENCDCIWCRCGKQEETQKNDAEKNLPVYQ